MIRDLAVLLGQRFKGKVFVIDDAVPLSAIFGFGLRRFICTLRGILSWPMLASGSGKFFFLGRGAVLRNKRFITIANGVTVGEGVIIDGLSYNGVILEMGASIGAHSTIVATSVMRALGKGCKVGRNSGIGQYSFIGCGGGVSIGENVIMGQYVSFHTENHCYENLDLPIISQGVRRSGIVIEDDVWVGVKATFLAGSYVHRGAIVAAGAVVRGEVPPFAIVGGVPAKIIGWRNGQPVRSEVALPSP